GGDSEWPGGSIRRQRNHLDVSPFVPAGRLPLLFHPFPYRSVHLLLPVLAPGLSPDIPRLHFGEDGHDRLDPVFGGGPWCTDGRRLLRLAGSSRNGPAAGAAANSPGDGVSHAVDAGGRAGWVRPAGGRP